MGSLKTNNRFWNSKAFKIIVFVILATFGLRAIGTKTTPTLNIGFPENGAKTQESNIEIKGTFTPLDKQVRVNNKEIQTENGSFLTKVDLNKGKNDIKIEVGGIIIKTTYLTITRESTEQERAEEKSKKEAEQAKEDEAKKPFSEKDLTENIVRSILSKNQEYKSYAVADDEITQIKVLDTFDENNHKAIHIYFKPKTVWDEKTLVKTFANISLEVMKRLFTNPQVGAVFVWEEGDFIDQYGKSEPGTAVRVEMNRKTAGKIEWENFKNMVSLDYNNLFDIATNFYIHPAILKKL